MAVRFDNSADGLLRTTDLLDTDAVYTFMFWVYIASDLNAFSTFWTTNAGGYPHSDWIGTDSDGTTLQLYSQAGGGGVTNNGSALSVGTWYHITMVRSSTSALAVYLNGVSDASNTVDVSARTNATRQEFAGTAGSDPGNIRIFDSKAWSAALSIPEIFAEMQNIQPQRFTNLYGWWPFFAGSGERVDDYSGNARDWTEAGTLTDEDNPPVAWDVFIPQVQATTTSAPLSVEQEGFRWRNDDGSETTATWLQAQDVDASAAKETPVRLRMLINATNDPAASHYKLQYKPPGADTWEDVTT